MSVNILFQYPSLESVHDIKAHSTDVDDLDVHPNSNWVSCVLFIFNITFIIITNFRFIYFLPFWFQFVTCSRDTTAYVWRLEEGRKQFQLYFSANNEPENFFRIRACR